MDFGQPEGLKESSRGLSAARYPRIRVFMIFDPERVTELVWAPFQGAEFYADFSGGLRFAATPGYSLATLRVANLVCQVGYCP